MYSSKIEEWPTTFRLLGVFAQRVWFFWGCFVFLITGLFALFFYVLFFNLLDRQRATKYTYYVTQCWGRAIMAGMLVRITTEGTDRLSIKEEEACIIVSNHLSMCDIPICMGVSPIPFSFLAKKEADKIPIVGYLARNMHVYVDRKNKESREATAQRMQQHIFSGHSIMVYAEGTRNITDQPLRSFYDGAFRLAIETQKPLVVLTICNSSKITNPKEPFRASPAWVHTVWDEPISTVGMTLDDIDELKELARNRMLGNLESFQSQQLFS